VDLAKGPAALISTISVPLMGSPLALEKERLAQLLGLTEQVPVLLWGPVLLLEL
jgi:hypothetical protein